VFSLQLHVLFLNVPGVRKLKVSEHKTRNSASP